MTEPRQQRLTTTSSILASSGRAAPSAAPDPAPAAMSMPISVNISRDRIQSIWKTVQQQAKQKKYQFLQELLRDKRDAVLLPVAAKKKATEDGSDDNDEQQQQQEKATAPPFAGLLSKTTISSRPDPITGSLKAPLTVTTSSSSSSVSSYNVPVVPFCGGGSVVRLPMHKFCTMAITSYRVNDVAELHYVPSAIADVLPIHQDDSDYYNHRSNNNSSDDDDAGNKDKKKKKKQKATTTTSNSNSTSSPETETVAAAASGDCDGGPNNNNSSNNQQQQPETTRTRQYFDLFQTKAREREIEAGPIHAQQERNENIRQVIQQIIQEVDQTAAYQHSEQEQDPTLPLATNNENVMVTDELISLVANALRFEPSIVREAVIGPTDKSSNGGESSSSLATLSSLSSSPQQQEQQKKQPPPPLNQRHRKAPPPLSSNNSSGSAIYCGICNDDTNAATQVQQEQDEEEAAYLKLQDSLRHLWCPRCYIYDCSIHHDNGMAQPAKPSLQLSLELGWLRERQVQHEQQQQQRQQQQQQQRNSSTMTTTNHAAAAAAAVAPENETDENANINVTTMAAAIQTTATENNNTSNSGLLESSSSDDDNANEMKSTANNNLQGGLTSFHMSIAHRYYAIFQGDVDKMAIVMQAPRQALEQYIKARRFVLPREEKKLQQPPSRNKGYYSTRNYNQKWVKEIASDLTSRPSFQPCVHDTQVCNPDVCSCILHHQFCTKFCAWRNQSKNFFRGCECKSNCGPSCSCNAHGRECDPDLCRCDACTDPPGPAGKTQLCRNDNVTMRRGVPLMVGISEIPNAGFGVFSKHDLATGTFLGEYVGEIISQDEAERRGQLYDIRNHSCLFNFSSDLVVDADARASRLRFLNHSTTPNCEPKLINVAGGTRIAFFTLKKIAAQTELTFNYSYDEMSSTNCASFIHRNASVEESAKEKWFRYTVTENVNEVKRSDNAASKKKNKSRPSKRSTSDAAKKMDCKPSPKANRRHRATTTSATTRRQLKPPPPLPALPPTATTTVQGGGLRHGGQARMGQVHSPQQQRYWWCE